MKIVYKNTLISLLFFVLGCFIVSFFFGFFGSSLYYIIGLGIYLPLFLVSAAIYERKLDYKFAHVLILLLWGFSVIFSSIYISIQGLGGTASEAHAFISGKTGDYLYLKAYIVVSFPYFSYVISFLGLSRVWKDAIIGVFGYVLVAIFFYIL